MRGAIVIFILTGFLSCSTYELGINGIKDDSKITTLNGTWRVISFENYVLGEVEYPTDENSWGKEIVVTFDDTSNPKKLTGTNITNVFQGEFEYIGSRQFAVENLASTEIAQPEWADRFLVAILDEEVEFKINSQSLRVYYDQGNRSLTLVRE